MYNLSDYFANRKLFKLDNKGKSPAFFLKKKNYKLNKFAIKKLKEFSTNNNNINCRICLHQSLSEKIHSMLVLINNANKFDIHKHEHTPEFYQLINGKIKITLYTKTKKKIKELILKNKGDIYSVSKNQFHNLVPLTKFAIFQETKNF
ncbi:MAG: hypothetical protein CMG02_00035 [Candidatus Marinimicrobia bacterium]|nr:hypothetical protein [Candidatus Neomarinimicrobiota bacterium]|tara:strand:- start:2837 stop:3280 length:444 start_codon:yes stop_codon:yes gene_type:complete